MDIVAKDNTFRRSKIHPKKFALGVACASIVMMFVALSSAYMVREAQGNWVEFALPTKFFFSTAALLLSSLSLHFSYFFFKKEQTVLYRSLLTLAFFLGIAFVAFQYQGWVQIMMEAGLPLGANPSADFVYAITFLHAAHVLGGLIVLIMAMIHAFYLKHRVTERRKLRFEMTILYWHFVDFLWLYLLLFLIFHKM